VETDIFDLKSSRHTSTLPMPVRLLPECAHRGADASPTMMIADERAGWPRLISPARLANRAIKDHDNDQLKFTTDETDASVRYFGHTGSRFLTDAHLYAYRNAQKILPHRGFVWVILADFDRCLLLLLRCGHVGNASLALSPCPQRS